MNIENHYLVPQRRIRKNTNKALHQMLADVVDAAYGDGQEQQNNLLVLFYLCSFLSAEELSYYLGLPENSFKSLHVQLNYMENHKLIHKTQLKSKDGSARSFYYLSQEGFRIAATLFSEGITVDFKRKGKEASVMHDYSVGMNVFHLLLFRVPFTFMKEICFGISARTGRDTAGTLRVDAICLFKNRPERIYIEEDLGNEPNGTLIDKLVKYQRFGNMEHAETEVIVYSFRKPYCTAEPPAFPCYSPTALRALISHFMAAGIISLADFLKSHSEASESLPENEYKLYKTADSLGKTVGIKTKTGSIKGDMSLEEIIQFAKEVEELKNDWRNKDLNAQQNDFATAKFRMLTGLILSKFRKNEIQTDLYLFDIMRGFSVFAVPTSLLINFLPFICMGLSNLPAYLESKFKKFDAEISFQGLIMKKRLMKGTGSPDPLALRNIFVGKNAVYALEYVSKDIGGLLRAVRFRSSYLSLDTRITLFCLVDSFKDALFLSGKDYLDAKGITFPSSSRIYFLLRNELDNPVPFVIRTDGTRQNIRL